MPISLIAINSTLAFSVENMFYEKLIHMRDMTHSLLWCATCLYLSSQSILRWPSPWRKCSTRNSFICVPWLIHHYDAWHTYISHRNQFYVGHLRGEYVLWHDSFMCVTWLMHHRGCVTWLYLSSQLILRRSSPWRMCSTSHLFICMTWRIHNFDAWHAYISHRNQFNIGLLRGECVLRIAHSYAWHDSFTTWMRDMPTSLIALNFTSALSAGEFFSDVTRSYVWHDSFTTMMRDNPPLPRN